ncbi:MAG: glycosyltransferase [Phycisphaerales bacterium]|nr:glycosyltransferase [Phycisphaerales bacterium]
MPDYRVLLVAYHFPPIAGSGVQRALKLAKYLPNSSAKVHVLTCGHSHYPLLDDTLMSEIETEPRIRVHRVCGFDPGGLANRLVPRWNRGPLTRAASAVEQRVYWRLQSTADRWAMPEPEQWWIGSAIRAARRLHGIHGFDAVITTSPPHSCQRVGIELQRTLKLPWIADLRDPIVDNFAYAPRNAAADQFWNTLERDIFDRADSIVTTCPDYAALLTDKYAGAASRTMCITNGFDESDRPAAMSVPRMDAFVISHVGAFYHSQSVGPLLNACRVIRARRPDARIRLRLVGSVSRQQAEHFIDADSEFVQRAGYSRHADALTEMVRANALFLMTPTVPAGRNCIPAKLFEYLAFGRVIVALAHRGSSVDSILQSAGCDGIAYHDNADELADRIETAYDAWRSGFEPRGFDENVVATFRRDQLAERYAALIDSIIRQRRSSRATTRTVVK